VIELPAGAPADTADTGRAAPRSETTPTRTILVVDDEPDVAELLAEALLLDGHRVDIANSGAVALTRIDDASYDLVFSDMKMPGMSGIQLYDEIARRWPGLERRMIFVTGDTLNPAIRQFLDRTSAFSVSKPFEIGVIRRLVSVFATSPSVGEPEVALSS
jgi:CheY-like chemotaxis protein